MWPCDRRLWFKLLSKENAHKSSSINITPIHAYFRQSKLCLKYLYLSIYCGKHKRSSGYVQMMPLRVFS